MARIWGAAAVSLLALANCGGGGGAAAGSASSPPPAPPPTPQTDPAAYFSQVIEPGYDSFSESLVGNTYTGATAMADTTTMPTSGTATYNGYALVGANRLGQVSGAPKVGVEGTATLTADFANNTVAGSATNFVGGDVGSQNTTTGKFPITSAITAYPGTITISNGCIGTNGCSLVTRPNQMQADFSGTLTGVHTITTSGQLLADFKGTPIQGIAVTGGTINTTVDGTAVPSGFYFYVKP